MNRLLPLFRKLEIFAALPHEEREALDQLATSVRRLPAHSHLIQEGTPPDGMKIILEGIAYRYKMLPDGRRQIVGYLIPGDFCDLRAYLLRRMDHSIATFGPVQAALLQPESVQKILEKYPRLLRALWWSTLVDEAVTREWLLNVGHRTAFERLAHLFCEIFARLEAVGLTQQSRCDLALTQTELADTLALSAVHVNRTLMEMRRANLVSYQGRQLILHDRKELESLAGFDPSYLHLESISPRGTEDVAASRW
jgi:CRP-like cAMP-binding protein